jgi:hypothetical protein
MRIGLIVILHRIFIRPSQCGGYGLKTFHIVK